MTTPYDCVDRPAEPKPRPSIRVWGVAAAGIVAAAGCTSGEKTGSPVAYQPEAPRTSDSASVRAGAPSGSGIVAKPASTAFSMEARDIRLVRLDQQDIALQFELFNGTQEPVEPYDVGLGLIERNFKLVDLPRATAYDVQQANGFDGRVSDKQYDEIAPGSAATITAVFTAPPPEATKLWFMTNVLLPVEVPIEPAGSPALEDDPVLTGPRGPEPYVATLVCTRKGPEGGATETPVEIKLPSDVLFQFAKSDLTPAAQSALDEVWRPRLRVLGAELGPSLLVTSALFALGHLATELDANRLAVFFPALLFGWLRARTGGVGASIALHALCNLFASYLARSYGLG